MCEHWEFPGTCMPLLVLDCFYPTAHFNYSLSSWNHAINFENANFQFKKYLPKYHGCEKKLEIMTLQFLV